MARSGRGAGQVVQIAAAETVTDQNRRRGGYAQLLDLRRQLRGLPPIVICDCGLDEEGLSRARELTQRYDNVLLLAPEEIVQNLP